MEVEFIAEDPRARARPRLDTILSRGEDQLVVGCAFCTGAGVQVLKRHASLLGTPDSFVVVAAAPPTDYSALEQLHDLVPGKLFVHWGAISPVEISVGAALMHSKVFYARAKDECWLWTGSHNLTGNATQGFNCEAALLLHGSVDEQPFVHALRHLKACLSEARPYDPDSPPPDGMDRVDIIAIHAEVSIAPTDPFPWHIHLCLDTADFDKMLAPPADVRLFLYTPGSLANGWRAATPLAAFAGSLTGQNLTARNPRAGAAGVEAEWQAAGFSITEQQSVLEFDRARPPGPHVTTQAVFSIDRPSDREETLFSQAPKAEFRMIPGRRELVSLDPDMKRFYRKSDCQGDMLIHVPIAERQRVVTAPTEELRSGDHHKLLAQLAPDPNVRIEAVPLLETKERRKHPFIMRAKYRLRGGSQ